MENALLYTLSTVAQALAGALALLAAFALYKLQSFEAELREIAVSAMQPFLQDQTLVAHVAHGRYAEALAAIDRNLGGADLSTRYSTWQDSHVERMRFLVGRKGELSRSVWASVAITLLTMCGAVVALTFVPQVIEIAWARRTVLMIAAAMFIACVGTYVPLLRALLR